MTSKEKFFSWSALIIATAIVFYCLRGIMLPFVFGILVAYFLDPVADYLEEHKISRTGATTIITLTFFGVFAVISILLVPVLYEQFLTLAQRIPVYVTSFWESHGDWLESKLGAISPNLVVEAKEAASNVSGFILKFAGKFVGNIWQSGVAFLNLLSLLVISPVVAFYMLRDWDHFVAKVDSWLPRDHAATIESQAKEIDTVLAGWIRGQTNVCMLLGIFYAIGLSMVGLEFGLIIGLATGILSFIPYAGMLIGMATGLGVAFFQFSGELSSIGMVLGVFVAGQVLEGNFITPKLVGDKVGLHPVWIMFAMLAGAALMGFIGILYGLENKLQPSPKIWGNAYDEQYALPQFPHNYAEANRLFKKGKIVRNYLKQLKML